MCSNAGWYVAQAVTVMEFQHANRGCPTPAAFASHEKVEWHGEH